MLDVICGHFLELLHLHPHLQRPKAQDVAILAWALQRFKHVPASALASAMINRMFSLCQSTGQQPTSPEISNFLLASAQLQFTISADEAGTLLHHLLSQDTATTQELANSAWSLAALGFLQLDTFQQLLCCLRATSTPLTPPNLRQMYQALDRLQPPSDATPQQHKAWSDAEADLQALGRRPTPKQNRIFAQLPAALNQLGLKYIAPARVKSYSIQAAIQPQSSTTRPILVSVGVPDCFSNQPTRLTGRAVFRRQLLSQEGMLLSIPEVDVFDSDATRLAEYLKPRLQAAAGESLEAYRASSDSDGGN